MKREQMRKELANEAVELLREFITNCSLLGNNLVKSIRSSDCGDSIIIEDLFGTKKEYSLSEISYVLTDSIDGLGTFNKNLLETIKSAKDENEEYGKLQEMLKSLENRLKEIEKNA